MSMYIRNEAEYQKQRALATKRVFMRRAREDAMGSLNRLATKLENADFPPILPNITLQEQEERKARRVSWLASKFEDYAQESGYPLAEYAAQKLRETAKNLFHGIYEPTGRKRELKRNVGGLGVMLTTFRLKRGISQLEIQRRTGLSNDNISTIENDKRIPIFYTLSHYIRGTGANFTDEDVLSLMRESMGQVEKQNGRIKLYPSSEAVGIALDQIKRDQPELLLIGNYLRYLRERTKITDKSLSKKELAQRVGCAEVTIIKYEQNAKMPTIYSLIDVLCALGFNSTSMEAYIAWVIALEQNERKLGERKSM